MALVEDAIYSRSQAHAGLFALISTRCYPVKLPQKPTLPALVYQRMPTTRYHAGGQDAGVISARYQLTGFATTAKGSMELREQIIAAFSRFSGTVADVVIQDIMVENDIGSYEDETGQFMCPVDVLIHHEAA